MNAIIHRIDQTRLYGQPLFQMTSDHYWNMLLLSSLVVITLVTLGNLL